MYSTACCVHTLPDYYRSISPYPFEDLLTCMHGGWWGRKHTGYCVVKVFNSQYTFQEGTRLRGLHAGLEKKRMYEEGTVLVEHDPPVQVALATLVYKCQLLSK